jgi:hypothetical protein
MSGDSGSLGWSRFRRWLLLGETRDEQTPQCHFCRHHQGGACPAYPGGIPLAILTNQIDHRTRKYPLDRGLRFAPFSVESDQAQRALFDRAD